MSVSVDPARAAYEETVGSLTIAIDSPISLKIGGETWSLASSDLSKEYSSRFVPGRPVRFRLLDAGEPLVLDVGRDRQLVVSRPALGYGQDWEVDALLHPHQQTEIETVAIRSVFYKDYVVPGATILPVPLPDIPIVLGDHFYPWKVVPIREGFWRVVRIIDPFTGRALQADPKVGASVILKDRIDKSLINQVWVISDL